MQVVAIALEDFVLLQTDFNEQVTGGTTIGTGFTVAAAADAHTVVNACGNFDFQCFLFFDFALTMTRCAGVGDGFSAASAMRASLLHAEKALAHLHHALALAGTTGFDGSAWLGTGAATGGAFLEAGDANLRLFAHGGFFKGHIHGVT